jgi:hypothetical protein
VSRTTLKFWGRALVLTLVCACLWAGFAVAQQGGNGYSGQPQFTLDASTITLAGNVTGPASNNTVVELQNNALAPGALIAGQIMGVTDAGTWAPLNVTGDLTNSATNPGKFTVADLQSFATSTTTPTVNYSYIWDGGTWGPAQVSLGGTGVTGTLPAGDLPSISTSGDVACSGTGGALTSCNVGSITGIDGGNGFGAHSLTITSPTTGFLGLSSIQASYPVITFSMTLTGNYSIGVPNVANGFWFIDLRLVTFSAHTLTICINGGSSCGDTCGALSSITGYTELIAVHSIGGNAISCGN